MKMVSVTVHMDEGTWLQLRRAAEANRVRGRASVSGLIKKWVQERMFQTAAH